MECDHMRSPFSPEKQSHLTKVVDVCRRSLPPRLSLNSQSTCFGRITTVSFFAASSSPQEMRQHLSLQFPLTQTCRTKEQFMEIETSFRGAFLQAIRPLPESECFESGLCSIGDVKMSGCEHFTEGRKKRAVGSHTITTIECTVIFRTSKRNASAPSAAEKAGSVAFQLQYVVSMGQFTMNISENVLVARQGSLQHLSSEFTCGLGFFTDIGNSSCGKWKLRYYLLYFTKILLTLNSSKFC